jgi:hypothetical protein
LQKNPKFFLEKYLFLFLIYKPMERAFPQQKSKDQSLFHNFHLSKENRSLFINWVAGLLGGFTSVTIFSPFDLARTRHILLVLPNLNPRIIVIGRYSQPWHNPI